jgi:hypothetical protein
MNIATLEDSNTTLETCFAVERSCTVFPEVYFVEQKIDSAGVQRPIAKQMVFIFAYMLHTAVQNLHLTVQEMSVPVFRLHIVESKA